MKRVGRIAVCLLGWLALNAGLRAADPASANNPLPDNPYATIVARNIFGLVAPPPPPDPNAKQEASLPKITPTGIMTVFGHSQVLFKVAGAAAKQGQTAKDEFYILSQGQRQDDIEVAKIDEKNSLVTFDNHGITQELPLVNTPTSSGPAASPSPVAGNPAMMPALPGGIGNNGPGGIIQFGAGSGGRNGSGGFGGGGSGFGGAGNGANGANSGLPIGGSTQGRTYQPEASTMSPEESQILIAAQHLKAITDHDPTAPLFPPTQIDGPAGITGPGSGDGGPPGP
jgi:hypothetical protein